jgi:drug/metabolite transporter (DMT)-like permease
MRNLFSIWPGILSALILPFMGACISQALKYYAVDTLLCLRFLISAMIFVCPYLFFGYKNIFKTRLIIWHILRAISGCSAIICLFFTLPKIPLVYAVLMTSLTPVYLLIFFVLFDHFVLDRNILFLISLCCLGILYIINPWGTSFNLGYLFGLSFGFFNSLSVLILRHLKNEPISTTMSFYYVLSTLFVLLIFGVKGFSLVGKDGSAFKTHIFWFILAIVSSIAYQSSLTFALKRVTSHVIAPLFFLSFIVSIIIEGIEKTRILSFFEILVVFIIGFASMKCSSILAAHVSKSSSGVKAKSKVNSDNANVISMVE